MDVDGLLAVDCSLRLTGVALAAGGKAVVSETRDLGRRQSAELPLVVERLLKDAGWTWGYVRRVAVTSGPGYFTGIRVGAAYALALAYGLGVPLVPVPSLELLALSRPDGTRDGGVLVLVYAGRGAVYAASFGAGPVGNPLRGPDLPQGEYGAEAVAAWLGAHPGVSVISDDPARALGAIGPLPAGASGPELSVTQVRPDAARLAEAAWGRPSISPAELRITYCRAPL
ncbi:MAG: tRNA (adenosine(37)-N6)-threonylcarbamoyltransferase complex dimerization subunit type 1 TsaB [Fretibacterium sp.]|nr:tRNA (adenosine(37)-N6)-threonylcarbamoyltransferase complex dimerization subunit type 1 TsaB [Fretibacterium sp.]